jgi:hypothetical protein
MSPYGSDVRTRVARGSIDLAKIDSVVCKTLRSSIRRERNARRASSSSGILLVCTAPSCTIITTAGLYSCCAPEAVYPISASVTAWISRIAIPNRTRTLCPCCAHYGTRFNDSIFVASFGKDALERQKSNATHCCSGTCVFFYFGCFLLRCIARRSVDAAGAEQVAKCV